VNHLPFRRSSIALALTVALGAGLSFLLPKPKAALACVPPDCAAPDLPVEKGPQAQIPIPAAQAGRR
jgi:hypothetical protein